MTDRIQRTCHLRATPDAVWQALTNPEWLCSWLADEATLDLVPGGEARFVVDGHKRTGWIEEVSPPEDGGSARLSFWWQEDDEPASRVTFELTPSARGTLLRIDEARPLEILDLVGLPPGRAGDSSCGPVLVAA